MALNWKIIHSEIKNGIKNFNFRPYKLARKLGVSISYLNEFVWENYGVRLGKLIETYKLDKAIDLLSPGAKVKDVFKDCGYWRLRSFRRAFKRRLGISPSEFKQIIVNSYDENLVKKYKEILWGVKGWVEKCLQKLSVKFVPFLLTRIFQGFKFCVREKFDFYAILL